MSSEDHNFYVIVAFLICLLFAFLFGLWIESHEIDINCRRDTGYHWRDVDWQYDCTAKKRE